MAKNRPRYKTLLLLASLWLCGAPAVVVAQSSPPQPSDPRRVRSEVFFGAQNWSELSELTPAAGGSFDSTGVNLGAAFHWRLRERERSDLLAGIDFALFPNESNVRHLSEDLLSRGLYVTPSVKLLFDDGDGPRYGLDFGFGYYLVDIAEVETAFGGYFEDELWEASAFGGYIGASIDFPTEASNRRRGFSMSAKIHFFDLGVVSDEGFVAATRGTLGPNAGSLSGPVIMFQFGYHWY